ncbi:hypothetical protein ABZ297_37165 [Nonomuraea sp. NPDC005983]|uniref:hypothetical protein n=1 Tax=Nonomuraea sp. NPDC005983 TaxID=3155595 RepID=UPI0033B553D5
MDAQLVPHGGAIVGAACPETALSWDGHSLSATDATTGDSLRLTPAALYHYRYDEPITTSEGAQQQSVTGLAALDADGLVLLDLPGSWHAPDVHAFTVNAGIPVVDGRAHGPHRARATLAARAPGWRRLRGLRRPFLARWRMHVSIGVGVAGLALMVYLASTGMWFAWRGLSSVGRILLDILEAKWLFVAFSPALLVLRPISARLQRRRIARGEVVSTPGGLTLTTKEDTHRGPRLQVRRGQTLVTNLPLRGTPGRACGLLLYSHEDRTGLFIMDADGSPLHHLPGPWPSEQLNRFAQHIGLSLAVHRLPREEYLNLIKTCPEATP